MKEITNAFPETPDRCREAVIQAVGTYREDKETMKKRFMTPVLAMALVLALCATAYAITGFSLRDAAESPSKAFEKMIVPVENTKKSHGLTITVGDALCDGTDMLAAVTVKKVEDMEPVYMAVRLEAMQDGKPLDVEGGLSDAENGMERKSQLRYGLLYPACDDAWPAPGQLLYEGTLGNHCTGTIQWTLHFDLYTLNWPLAENAKGGSDPLEEALGFFEKGQIAYSNGNIDFDWIDAAMFSQANLIFEEVLTDTGAFTLSDTLAFPFETEVDEPVRMQDNTIHQMDGYTIQVQEMTCSPVNLEYTLLFRFEKCQIPEGESGKFAEMDLMSKVRFLPEGTIFRGDNKLTLSQDGMTATYKSKVRYIRDEPVPKEITFHWMALSQEDKPDAIQEFIVIPK